MLPSTERFSSRVHNYVRFRPGYPPGIIALLRERCGLSGSSVVADIGSGTGILTALLLEVADTVFAVEPNAPMRHAAEAQLASRRGFQSIAGTAEATTLPSASVDLATAAQAFHWFDVARTRAELTRVLRPENFTALIWNERPADVSPFLRDYEALLRKFAPEYDRVTSARADAIKMREFFGGPFELATFANEQRFDLSGLTGRLMSSSYAPEPGNPTHVPMLRGLEKVFVAHQRGGMVTFPYRTLVHFARFNQ